MQIGFAVIVNFFQL